MPRNKEFDYDEKLETARNLFWEKGYHATSMHDLVDTLALNRSSIYATYGSKHDLFLKCLSNYAALKYEQYRAAGLHAPSPLAALTAIIMDVVKQTIKDNKTCLMVKSGFELAEHDMEVKQLIIDKGTKLGKIFEKLLAAGQKDGTITNTSSAKVLSLFLLSGFSGLWNHYILSRNRKEVEEMAALMIRAVRA